MVAIVLIAIAVMTVAAFLPFLQTPCGGCLATSTHTLQVNADLVQASDAWVVLAMVVLLAIAALLHLRAIRPALTALMCLAFSCAAVALPFVEAANNGSLLFPGATGANTMTPEAGFYVFVLGAALAALASLALLVASVPHGKQTATAPLTAAR
jgi:hypothetical protein